MQACFHVFLTILVCSRIYVILLHKVTRDYILKDRWNSKRDCSCWLHIIWYDRRCYFNVRSKADMSQLNLPILTMRGKRANFQWFIVNRFYILFTERFSAVKLQNRHYYMYTTVIVVTLCRWGFRRISVASSRICYATSFKWISRSASVTLRTASTTYEATNGSLRQTSSPYTRKRW